MLGRPQASPARCTAAGVVLHGGAGSPASHSDGCRLAGEIALARLAAGADGLEAAVAAVVALENDGRFNAGTGASLRMDGITIEADAAVMDTRGRLGAVAALRHVPNPVKVARAVADTPHWLLAGGGAHRFAARLGLVQPFAPSDRAAARYRKALQSLMQQAPAEVEGSPYERFWNFERPWQEVLNALGTGTVGAIVRTADGNFAVATSTGGSMPQLLGRVGDTPIVGCGYYAGPAGAVAATGVGEHIVHTLLAVTVYRWLEQGAGLQEALDRGLTLIPESIDIGLIGMTLDEAAAAARPAMAFALLP